MLEELESRVLVELVYEGHGKVAGLKRLAFGKIDETFKMNGVRSCELLSKQHTMEGKVRPDGRGFVQMHGFIATRDGLLIQLTGIANGITRLDGQTVLRGANCYSCPTGKFARLNEIAVIWRAEMDDKGNIHSTQVFN